MKIGRHARRMRALVAFAAGLIGALSLALSSSGARAQAEEPIAYTGHGGFFDRMGNQIQVTQAFVERAQAWYREDMLSALNPGQKRELALFEQRLYDAVPVQGQARLVVRQRALDWLFANSPNHENDDRRLGKLRALEYALSWRLLDQPGQNIGDKREEFHLDPDVARKLESTEFRPNGGVTLLSVTVNSGQAYIDECMAAKVPIPPSINVMDPAGVAGWKSQGFIPTGDQFIVGSPAELRTYKSATPAGMCYALPRYTDATLTTVQLDGVICLSQETSKVCFWDNQMKRNGFSFPAGTRIPIGVANKAVDPMGRYQAGGAELLGGSGDVCTDCHAGENPYITHPRSNLGGGVLWESLSGAPQNLPTFAPNRYDPLVAAPWPQNQLSHAGLTVPAQCQGCHVKGSAGRFPHLSNELPGFCKTVLTNAISRTMPLGSPGSATAAATAFRETFCNAPPDIASADGGPVGWQHNLPSAAQGAVPVAPGTSPTSWYTTPENLQHIAYVGTDRLIHELFFRIAPNQVWQHNLPSAAPGAVPVAPGTSPTSWYTTPENLQHIAYVGTDGRIHELFFRIG
jgi:hypothetical protein